MSENSNSENYFQSATEDVNEGGTLAVFPECEGAHLEIQLSNFSFLYG